MSLLDKGRQRILVYPEITFTDSDGNVMTGPSDTPVETRASIQPAAQSGTSARRHEQSNEGFETESMYRLRLPRSFPFTLQAQSVVEWDGNIWHVMGDAYIYDSSPMTSHVEYTIRRN